MTFEERTGGHAFPHAPVHVGSEEGWATQEGMTLRDYFAAQAMVGLLTSARAIEGSEPKYERLVTFAFSCADAMLKARVEGGKDRP